MVPEQPERSTQTPAWGSERSGPGLPGPGDRKAPGEPARTNRPGDEKLAAAQPIFSSAADAARTGSKSSLKDGHAGENVGRRVRSRSHPSDRGSGLRAPTPAAIPIAPLQHPEQAQPGRAARQGHLLA